MSQTSLNQFFQAKSRPKRAVAVEKTVKKTQHFGVFAWLSNVKEAKNVSLWASPYNRQFEVALQRGPVRYGSRFTVQ